MGVLAVLLVLVSGFMLCHQHPQYFFKLHRYEGQYLYLQTAYLGTICLLISILLNLILIEISSIEVCNGTRTIGINYLEIVGSYLSRFGVHDEDKRIFSLLTIVSLSTLLMPIAISKWVYWRIKRYLKLDTDEEVNVVVMSELFSDSPLDQLLFSAMINDVNLMLILEDRKVYVGRVSTMGEPNENEGADQEISFLPLVSGYRDKESLKVVFTTDYKQIGESLPLVIKQDSILTAREFDFSVYKSFKPIQ